MNWIEYYLPKVNNKERETKFKEKYNEFLVLIQKVILEQKPTNVIELGCGTGIITKLLLSNSSSQILGDKNFIVSDVSPFMLDLARLNMLSLEGNLGEYGTRRLKSLQYVQYDICSRDTIDYKTYTYFSDINRYSDLVITHGVLEHFSKEIIKDNILETLNNDLRIGGHIHYVPTNEYSTKSFGDENLWSVSEWLELTNPDIAIKNGPDLFLYIKNER